MQNTSNYNLNIVEGTDIVNIPVQLNPNFQTIDSEMFKNKQGSTGTATEVVTGTVHAIVRANTDADVFRFTATGNWTSGDTMTVDGGAVTVHLTDGTAPGSGAYVIGAEVVAVINGTLVTLISSSAVVDPGVTSFNSRTGAVTPAASDYDASMIDYDNTSSTLISTDVQSAIDELDGRNDYSTSEHIIGEWIDGSILYEKTINCGTLPTASVSNTPLNISNLNKIVDISGIAIGASDSLPIPFCHTADVIYNISVLTNATHVTITTGYDRSAYTGYVTVRYTKTI